jgi:hypothetical protein
MNIFFLHLIPSICAQMHCDKHVVKMILETTQLLCSTWHIVDPESIIYKPYYKLTHKNHPSTKWVRESIDNYKWLTELGKELCKEYTYRYGKIHKCEEYINNLAENIPDLPNIGFTQPAQAMPATYKDPLDSVEAYRTYYFFDKNRMLNWKKRDPPEWIKEYESYFE